MIKIKYKHIRFLGAEGIGMSALIRILERQRELGIVDSDLKISKSDLAYPENDPLDEDIDLVVRSTAISDSDPDFKELNSRGLEIWHRRDMLNYLSHDFKQIVCTGTHGKTTCSAMLAHVLVECNQDPSFAIGGILANYNSNARAGTGENFVLEGDESDKSFTHTNPYLALVTNIEPDHLENYPGGIDEIKKCFFDFLDRAEIRVLNYDDPILAEYIKSSDKDCYTYSHSDIDKYGIELEMPGTYNQLNAAGVVQAATRLGVKQEDAVKALKTFKGIKRRFELINPNYRHCDPERSEGEAIQKIKVYDDYAHHPTEVRALLEGAMSLKPKRLVFVYQPHHPERTQQFWTHFINLFKDFPDEHLCLIADIYVARSKHIEGVNSKRMVEEINKANVRYLAPVETGNTSQGNFSDMVAALQPGIDAELEGCDYLFIVGAGNIAKVSEAYSHS